MKIKSLNFLKTLLVSLVCILALVIYLIWHNASITNDELRTSSINTSSIDKNSINKQAFPSERLKNQTTSPLSGLETIPSSRSIESTTVEKPLTFQDYLAQQAELRLQSSVRYDGSYHKIAYPMGDVPANIGVCTDVVIRSFRGLGVDLQERVHEDMKRNFRNYPTKWKLKKPDTNIDHRRVPNLMTYFKRAGAGLKITNNPSDYKTGNIVSWELSDGKGKRMVHIGIVSKYVSEITGNPLIIHNIGAGPQINDMLFNYRIIGHYKYGQL